MIPVNSLVISGPCSAETREQVLETALGLSNVGIDYFRAGIWKPRTRPGEFEGIGDVGISWMCEVRETYGLKIATEVAKAEHVEFALKNNFDYSLGDGRRRLSRYRNTLFDSINT